MTTSFDFLLGSTLEETTRVLSAPLDRDHNRLISILSVAQHYGFDFLPVTWLPNQEKAGAGGQSEIYQHGVRDSVGLVFKALSIFMHTWPDEDGESQIAMAVAAIVKEMSILSRPLVRDSQFILKLEGVSWNVQKDYAWPVLVYRKGTPLRDWLVGRPGLSLEQKLYASTEICLGLAALHKSGVVHADMKPSNIIMSRRKWPEESGNDDEALPKISDLGASLIGSNTDLFQLPRSRGWTAPEWHERFFQIQNARLMDVFSLGLVVYWILAWDTKFSHLSVDEEAEEMIRLTNPSLDEYGLPLQESIKLLNSMDLGQGLRETLTTFFSKSLAPNPQDRARNAEELLPFLDKDARLPDTSTASSSSAQTDGHTLCRFYLLDWIEQLSLADFRVREQIFEELKSATMSGCLACRQNCSLQAAICCELAFGCELSIEGRDEYLTAGYWTNEVYQAELRKFVSPKSRSLPAELQYFFQADLAHEYQRRQEVAMACKHLKREVAARSRKLGNTHLLTAPLKAMLAVVLDAAGQIDEALAVQIDLYTTLNTRYGQMHPIMIAAMSQLALYYHNAGHSGRALVTGQDAYELCEKYLRKDDRTRMNTMANLAIFLYQTGKYQEANDVQKEVVEQHEEMLGIEHPDTVKCYLNQAVFMQRQHVEVAAASRRLWSVFKKYQSTTGVVHRDALWAQSNLLDCLADDYLALDEEVLEYRELIFTYARQFLGESHTDTWLFAKKVVSALAAMGRWEEARDLYETLKAKLEHLCGPTHDVTLNAMLSFARDHQFNMLHEEAYIILDEVLDKSATLSGLDSDTAIKCLMEMGRSLDSQEKFDDAETVWKKVIFIADTRYKDKLSLHDARIARSNLGLIYFKNGKREEGREIYKELIHWTTNYFGPDEIETMSYECNLAADMLDAGRHKDGLASLLELRGRVKFPEESSYEVYRAIAINLMRAYSFNDMLDEAISIGEYCLPLFQKQLGELHEDTLKVQSNLCAYYIDAKKSEKGEELLSSLRDVYEKQGNEDMCLITLHNLAVLYVNQGRISDGVSLQREVMERQEIKSGIQSQLYMDDSYDMAKMLDENTDCLEEAEKWAKMSWEYFNNHLGYKDPQTVRGAWRLGQILQKLGKIPEAREVIKSQLKGARDMDSDDRSAWINDGEKILRELEMTNIENALGHLVVSPDLTSGGDDAPKTSAH